MGQRSPEARYQEIERWLRRRVLSSAPGDALPSESELAAQFRVSRMTARQAVQNLAAEGLVQRRRGAGTFVTPRPIHRHEGSLMSFTEDMRRRGMKASSRLLEAGLRPATSADLEALRLADGARVVAISRLRLADGVPLAIEQAALPSECAGSALLVERRIIYDPDGLPLEHTESAYNGDNYAIDAVFSVSRTASLPRSAAPAAPA